MYCSRDIPVQCNLKNTIRMPAQYTLLYTTGIFHSSTVCLLFSGSGDYQAVQAYQAQRWLPPAVGWSGEYALQEDHLVVRAVAARISLSGLRHPAYHCPDSDISYIIVRTVASMCNCVSLSGLWHPVYHCPVRGLWHPVYIHPVFVRGTVRTTILFWIDTCFVWPTGCTEDRKKS